MRSEEEIRKVLSECKKVSNFGLSNGPCPLEEGGEGNEERLGCCAECSFPSTVLWVLGDDSHIGNGQQQVIDAFKGE